MNVIKFRAWDGNKLIHFDFNNIYGYEGEVCGVILPDSQTVLTYNEKGINPELYLMRFTGFLDKNKKEVYEGDIFRVEEQADDRMYYLVIHWIKEWCMFGCLTVGEYTDYLATGISALDEPMFWTYTLEDTDSQKFFLCGNIYQNPKLIEP